MCVQMCMSVHVDVWRPEVDGVGLPPPLSHFLPILAPLMTMKEHVYRHKFHFLGQIGYSEHAVSILPSLV